MINNSCRFRIWLMNEWMGLKYLLIALYYMEILFVYIMIYRYLMKGLIIVNLQYSFNLQIWYHKKVIYIFLRLNTDNEVSLVTSTNGKSISANITTDSLSAHHFLSFHYLLLYIYLLWFQYHHYIRISKIKIPNYNIVE